MNTIILSLCSISSAEFFFQLKLNSVLLSYSNLLRDIGKLLFSKQTSDEKKESMFKMYSLKLLSKTFFIFFLTFLVLSPFILIIIIDYFSQFFFLHLIISLKGVLLSIVIVLIYAKLRGLIVK